MNRRSFLVGATAVLVVTSLPAIPSAPVSAAPQPYNWDRNDPIDWGSVRFPEVRS